MLTSESSALETDSPRRTEMSEHVIVGAGAVGSAAALLLAERGEHVSIVSRHGSGPEHQGISRIAADATDAERLTALTSGAVALYNCASPQYHQWFTDWPRPSAAARFWSRCPTCTGTVRLPGRSRRRPRWRPRTLSSSCGRRCGTTSLPPSRRAGSGPPRYAPATTSR